ncbi:AMP-binding protein [Marinibaculum pumilum]|uniref:AMP-binding protein n=1 Tax=Marinibaculum pumilum TaxID=1766165 RepID=A0ABV7L3T2_9PROT
MNSHAKQPPEEGGTPLPGGLPVLDRPAFPAATIARHRRSGHWPGQTLYQLLAARAVEMPDRTLLVDRAGRLSYAQTLTATQRLASGLAAAGIGAGDIVAVQLPNWREFPLLEYALSLLGAVCVPLPQIYRERELRLMLGLVQPRAMVIPDIFRGHDHRAMLAGLRPGLPGLQSVFVVGDPGDAGRPFGDLLQAGQPMPPVATDPDTVTEIVFTSGTTGEPKGVMHTANTNFCPPLALAADHGLGADDVVLMASTFGHQTGFVYGGQLPLLIGGAVVLMERWDADAALRLIDREKVTFCMGATPFLQDLVDAVGPAGGAASLRAFLCSGAPIPRVLLDRARDRLGCTVSTGWGMTEVGLVTLTGLAEAPERAAESDGAPLPGNEVRILDDAGGEVPPGEEGDLVCRCPSMFAGYYLRPEVTAAGFTADGWFRTGDRARQSADGHIRITGRSKDIIIRGGENIPVVEVEEVLHRHPAILRAAVVAVPDPRFQEKACAAVQLHPGGAFDFAEMRRHLEGQRLARQYHPEYLLVLDDFPLTPSGKVQKFLLRDRVVERLRDLGELPAATEDTRPAAQAGRHA